MPRSHRRALVTTVVGVMAVSSASLGILPAGAIALAASNGPSTFLPKSGFTVPHPPTAARVNGAVGEGVCYLDCQQVQAGTVAAGFGSFVEDVPVTFAAIIGYGVLDK